MDWMASSMLVVMKQGNRGGIGRTYRLAVTFTSSNYICPFEIV